VAAAAHVAVAKSSIITKVDLDTPALGQYDPVTSGVVFDNAEITITDEPGLGISQIENLVMLDS
jgi:L-alanine-DL-glutamate epimerase-like enolase superfamily enzyme